MKYSMISTETNPKFLGNEPQRPKILKTYNFSYVWALLRVYQDLKAKKKNKNKKRLGKQLYLALMSLHAILISDTS